MRNLSKTISRGLLAGVALAVMPLSAQAEEWRYAFEEALNEVQGVYATKFK